MNGLATKRDIENMKEEILREQREFAKTFSEKTDRDKSEIIAAIFIQSRKIREEIGYQTIVLKIIEDNLNNLQFDEKAGISAKIEVSVGAEIMGNGAKWILDVDVTKVNYSDLLQALERVKIPDQVKEKIQSKLRGYMEIYNH